MIKHLYSLIAFTLLTSCYAPKNADKNPAKELGPCEGIDGFQEVRGNIVCHQGRVLSENAADFVKLGEGFAVDKKAGIVYVGGSEIDGADVASFEILSSSYSRDSERAYYGHKPIPGADPATFVFVGYGFAKDKAKVYNFGSIAPDIDAASFDKVEPLVATQEMIPYPFFKDKTSIYYSSSKLSESYNLGIEVDPATFVYYGGPFIQANSKVYFSLRDPLDANPETFRFLGCSLSKIEDPTNHVFALNSPPRQIIFCYGLDGDRIIEKKY